MHVDTRPRLAGGGGVPSPEPVPPMPGPDVPGIELPNDPSLPPGSPVGPDIDDPPPEQPIPVREPPGTPVPEHVAPGLQALTASDSGWRSQ